MDMVVALGAVLYAGMHLRGVTVGILIPGSDVLGRMLGSMNKEHPSHKQTPRTPFASISLTTSKTPKQSLKLGIHRSPSGSSSTALGNQDNLQGLQLPHAEAWVLR